MKLAEYHINIGNATDTGRIREDNEDYMAHFNTQYGYCIIICDGMGGHTGGKVAAHHAIATIQQYLQDGKNTIYEISAALIRAIEFANFQLREMTNQQPELMGMGTTCVLALIKDGQLYTAHAGDSRLYLIRNGSAAQLTKDHSTVQELIDKGIMTEAEAELSDKKNQIVKALGAFEKVMPSVTCSPIPLHHDDKILLCSDGLTTHISKAQIAETVSENPDIQNASLKLVEMANERGGTDNITVQLAHYTGQSVKLQNTFSRKKKLTIIAVVVFVLLIGIFGYMRFRKQPSKSKDTKAESQLTTDSTGSAKDINRNSMTKPQTPEKPN